MNKSKAMKTDIDDKSNTSITNLDLSLLRRPIATSVTGFEEALRAYNDGTNELKKLLSKECDLIYECKVCRNIFRSLTNFISHKRVYCRSAFNSSDHFHFRNTRFSVQDISSIIETEQKVSNSAHSAGGTEKSKDLSGVVEHILWKQHQSRNSSINDLYNEISPLQHDTSKPQPNNETLMLDPVNDSEIAVYQSVQTENNNTNIKHEINEVHNMETKSNTIVGSDGKILKLFTSSVHHTDFIASDAVLKCKICNLEFETEKTLKLHLEMKHSPSSYVYQCPACRQKFSSSSAVLKHLSSDHKKSNRRIRLMRDNIIKKRVRADEASTKYNSNSSRELVQLKIASGTETTMKNKTAELSSNSQKKETKLTDDSNTCPSCLKKFDRKAVYISHVQMCSDIKDREQEKLKKRQAKDEAKMIRLTGNCLESEESSSISEQQMLSATKRKKKISTSKEDTESNSIDTTEENSEDIVDWNLDDDVEKGKLENIKKEIIQDEYKRLSLETENKQLQNNEQEDGEESSLIIDEKLETAEELKCPTCNKVFGTNEKLKYHLTFYHSRQKRFKCKMCEYQGYRKKDTMNHINFVHNANVTLETLNTYTETVSKAVNEEDVKIQNELKKNQLKIKRKMARERKRKKIEEERQGTLGTEGNVKVDNSIEVVSESESESTVNNTLESTKRDNSQEETRESIAVKEIKSEIKSDLDDDEAHYSSSSRESTMRTCKLYGLPNINHYEKVVKNVPFVDGLDTSPNSRPIRNRIKPVRKDFLYDLSDLLKKEADAHREQNFQSSNIPIKRELRKRAMSTHVRETPTLNTFDQPSSPVKKSIFDALNQPAIKLTSEVLKEQRNRRMSVFVPPARAMFPPQPRSPPYRPPATHKNAGKAYKMASKESDNNRASVYEPKFLWTICFEQENDKVQPAFKPNNVSAASSILQRLSAKSSTFETKITSEKPNSLTAEQLCRKFELINVTNINELDIAASNRINLNPGSAENNLMSLNLGESSKNEICVLQGCDSEDSEPKLEIENGAKNVRQKKSKRGANRKKSERRKSATNGQRRLTVMQRLQENKIRKSREQLFQRLIHKQDDEAPHDLET